ncbi:MAG: glycosyltransferase family 39 protein [Anaerolineales bacterium]
MKSPATNQRARFQAVVLGPLGLFLFALLLRLIPVLASRRLGIGLDDMFQYDMLARSLAAGHGFRWYAPADLQRVLDMLRTFTQVDVNQLDIPTDPSGVLTSFRAPLYPAFLAVIYSLTDSAHRFFGARLVQAAVGATLAPATYWMAHQLSLGQRLSRAAGLLTASWPLLVMLPLGLATEDIFLPLLAAAVLVLLRADAHDSRLGYLAAGLLLGLASLTRSVIVGFPLLVALWLWWHRRRQSAVWLLLPVLLLTVPWAIRNSLLHRQPMFVESSLGYNLYLGYHPEGTGTFQFGPSLDLLTVFDDAERDALGRRLALEFILEDPGRVPVLMMEKLGHFWGLEDRAFSYLYGNGLFGQWPPWLVGLVLLLLSLPLIVTLPLALLGWISSPRDRVWSILTLLLTWYIGIHMLIMAEERFHLALVPVLAVLAARGWQQRLLFWRSIRGGDPSSRRRAWLLMILLGFVLLNWGLELTAHWDRLQHLIQPGGWQLHLDY